MRKRIICFFFVLFCLGLFIGQTHEGKAQNEGLEKEVETVPFEQLDVRLSFKKKTVTTRNLKELLQDKGVIKSFSFQKNLPYLDDQMTAVLDRIYSKEIKTYESLFQKQLEAYGLFDDSERVMRFGVLLSHIEVRLPSDILYQLKKIEGIEIELL